MPVSFAGLPTSTKVVNFVDDLLRKSGELHNQPSFEMALKVVWENIVLPSIDNGDLEVIQVGDEKWMRNTSSRMTKDNRICLQPRNLRHSYGGTKGGYTLAPKYAEEQEFRAHIRWTLNPQMMEILQKAALVPEIAEDLARDPSIRVAHNWVRTIKETGQYHFYICPFFDDVGREYGEGLLTYTGNQMVRHLVELYDAVPYSLWEVKYTLQPFIKEASGVDLDNYEEVLERWQDILTGKWEFKNPWLTLRMAIFYWEVVRYGCSGALIEYDFKTSGPMLLGLMSFDRNMLADTNMLGVDGRDCRNTVVSLVTVPNSLKKWEKRLKSKDTAKPFVTQTTYGQGPKGAVSGMVWKDDSKAPLSWINAFGIPNEAVLDAVWTNKPNLFNPDWIEILRELGWVEGYSAFYDLSAEYYNAFWGAYHHLKRFCQQIEEAGKAHMLKTGKKPEFTNIGGWTYHHHKWEIPAKPKTIRCRYNGTKSKDFPKGFEVSIGELVDTASPYSLVVRMTHQADAWIRMMISFAIRKYQMAVLGRYYGHAAVHDAFLVPIKMAPIFHDVVRPVLHQFVNRYVPLVHKFLSDNGQEPPTISKKHLEMIHWSIAHNKAWLNL